MQVMPWEGLCLAPTGMGDAGPTLSDEAGKDGPPGRSGEVGEVAHASVGVAGGAMIN